MTMEGPVQLGSVTVCSLAGDVVWGPADLDFHAPCYDLQETLAETLMWPRSYIKLLHEGEELDSSKSLEAADVCPGATISLLMSSQQEILVSYIPEAQASLADVEPEVEITNYFAGLYKLLDPVVVGSCPSIESEDVTELDAGGIVNVVALVLHDEEDRIRGRIVDPVEGWISIAESGT